jgi:hypothetical protein
MLPCSTSSGDLTDKPNKTTFDIIPTLNTILCDLGRFYGESLIRLFMPKNSRAGLIHSIILLNCLKINYFSVYKHKVDIIL